MSSIGPAPRKIRQRHGVQPNWIVLVGPWMMKKAFGDFVKKGILLMLVLSLLFMFVFLGSANTVMDLMPYL